jgi:hypothetical protein
MKLISLFVCAIAGAALMTRGQDAAQSTVDLRTKASPENLPTPLPANSPELPELSQLDEIFKQTSLGKTADDYRTHVEWRKLQNQVANDPAVVAAKKTAASARTDLEKRKRLGDYYKIYYERMQALAATPELKAALDGFKAGHLGMLLQPRVRPMPTPSPAPAATPAPSATSAGSPVPAVEPPLPSGR